MKPSGAIGRNFPDWVAVQKTPNGDVSWIVETKGRVWEGTEQKDGAIRFQCSQVTDLAEEPWKYMRVDQPIFKPDQAQSFANLVDFVSEREATVETMVLFSPTDPDRR